MQTTMSMEAACSIEIELRPGRAAGCEPRPHTKPPDSSGRLFSVAAFFLAFLRQWFRVELSKKPLPAFSAALFQHRPPRTVFRTVPLPSEPSPFRED